MRYPARVHGAALVPLDDMVIRRRVAGGDKAAFELLMRCNNRRLYRLARATLNEGMERLRKGARRQGVMPTTTSDGMDGIPAGEHHRPQKLLMRAEMRALIERKVDDLPKDLRIVFVLRSVEEMSVKETANLLGLDATTVRSRHFRARRLLRESLAQEIDLAERDLIDFAGAQCDRIVAAVNTRLDY